VRGGDDRPASRSASSFVRPEDGTMKIPLEATKLQFISYVDRQKESSRT